MSYRSKKNSSRLFILLLLCFLLKSVVLPAQTGVIQGRVLNGTDHSPLPFVHLRFNHGNRGTTTNIDGNFTIPDTVSQVQFSYIGFRPMNMQVRKSAVTNMVIYLVPDDNLLNTIEVYPRKDPAYRIIQMVLNHADSNDPEKLESYQYTSYHKFWLSADVPSEEKISGKKKISAREIEKLQEKFEASHMLLIETLSKKRFLKPTHENEEILTSKVAGLKKETFFLLSNQLQSFSIYKENFTLLGKNYLSPISKSALRNYAFYLEDTLQIDHQDTTFRIRFQPARDRNFDGLKGFLHINTHSYAVESVIAEPASDYKREIFASVWQHYELVDNNRWFPSELNAAINFNMTTTLPVDSLSKKRQPLVVSITANSRSYLYQTVINPPLDPKSFPKYGVTMAPGKKDSLMETGFRYIPLTPKDSSTYQYLDSLGKKARIYQKVRFLHALSLGTIPLGPVSINFMYLFGYNINEGYKVGLGLETNRRFSRYFTLGNYFTYGTRDGQFRHGEWLRIYPKGYADFRIQLGYRDVKRDFGEEELLTDFNIFEPEYFRSLLIKNMYRTQNLSASLEIRPIEPLNVKFYVDRARNLQNSYGNFSDLLWDPFFLTKTGLELRYSPGIAFMNNSEDLIQSAQPKSDFFFSIIQGLKLFKSEYQFTKIDSKAKFRLPISALGTTTVMIRGGKIFNRAPITDWFHGYGSNAGSFTLLPHFAFATMGLNEFSADQYAALHIRHNFGTGFIPSWYFIRPELVLVQNMGFGSLKQEYTTLAGVTDFRKGYYESGIELNKILNSNITGIGFGTYYRYGPYRLSNNALNMAYKLTINFKF
ncbi:MAG: DUF5686 family protein [Prolixibacteraceae bacterium]